MNYSTPGSPVCHQLLELTQSHVHWLGDAIQPSHPLLSPSPPAFNLSQLQGLFQLISSSHQLANVFLLKPQHHPSNEYSELIPLGLTSLISFSVQGTLKSLLQHHNSKASIFLVLSLLYGPNLTSNMTAGKTIAFTIWTFVSKVVSLLFNMLSSFVIDFLPRSKNLLISWLQSPYAMILETKNIKSVIISPSVCHGCDGTECHDLSFLNVEF